MENFAHIFNRVSHLPSFTYFTHSNSPVPEQTIGQNSPEFDAFEIPDPMDEDSNQNNNETSGEFD